MSKRFYFRLPSSLVFSIVLCLISILAKADYSSGPLDNLTKKQKTHYELYSKLSSLIAKHEPFDSASVYIALFTPVVTWCESSAPKYKFESMKAGDKAKNTTNPQVKKDLLNKSAVYADLLRDCDAAVKKFKEKKFEEIIPILDNISTLERECKTKGYQFLQREWLTFVEYSNLSFFVERSKKQQKKSAKDSQRKVKDARN